jgi:hypothetical protein
MGSSTPNGADVIRKVLRAAGPRPTRESQNYEKTKYAVAFADAVATEIAAGLGRRLPGVEATTARDAASVRGNKQLDVNFSTKSSGLVVGVSLKSVHIGDVKNGRYTHNMKRNEEELRIEASGYHKRQPYAVMIAVLFLPFDACTDGRSGPSSFGSWVRHLRPYAGRASADDEIDRFEKIYIGLYADNGTDLRFFDVESDPPKNRKPASDGSLLGSDGRARRTLTYEEFLDAVYHKHLQRNAAEFRWSDGEEDPLELGEDESDA